MLWLKLSVYGLQTRALARHIFSHVMDLLLPESSEIAAFPGHRAGFFREDALQHRFKAGYIMVYTSQQHQVELSPSHLSPNRCLKKHSAEEFDTTRHAMCQWEFQYQMEVLYYVKPDFEGISPGLALTW